jgi:hypothetical protein
MKTYEFHPFADLFPMLDKDSVGFKALIEDIKANRQYEPVVLLEGKILDGRNRYNGCQHLGRDAIEATPVIDGEKVDARLPSRLPDRRFRRA